MMHEIKSSELQEKGFICKNLTIPSEAHELLVERKWQELDNLMLSYCKKGGLIFDELSKYANFNSIEHIIAIREAKTDEDGIWHCDGSRNLAFTWSLNEDPSSIEGGELSFRRKKSDELQVFSPPALGTLIVFCTGMNGFEHCVSRVTKGVRRTFAGWCSI